MQPGFKTVVALCSGLNVLKCSVCSNPHGKTHKAPLSDNWHIAMNRSFYLINLNNKDAA